MGCDIHIIVEHRYGEDDDWRYVPYPIKMPRNYNAFAKLANVRNYGDVKLISCPRGLPADWDKKKRKYFNSQYMYTGIESPEDAHSDSWLFFKEVLEAEGDLYSLKRELIKCIANTYEYTFDDKPENFRIVFNFDN